MFNRIVTVWAALAALLPHRSPAGLQIETYGMWQLDEPTARQVLEWITLTLIHYEYTGTAHLIFSDGSGFIHRQVLTGFLRGQPAFLYRCGESVVQVPVNVYWRLIGEHPSLRVYQLELKDNEL